MNNGILNLKHTFAKREIEQDQEKNIKEFKKNFDNYFKNSNISQMTEEMLNKYILYYIESKIKIMPYNRARQFLNELITICASIRIAGRKTALTKYNDLYYSVYEEFPRIMDLKTQLNRFVGYPVISYYPMIIDLNDYKRSKTKKEETHNIIMDQGYYEVLEILSNNSLILKKKFNNDQYIKLYVNKKIIQRIRKRDIIQMRINRKLFISHWEIDEVKACYLPQAGKFIK